MGVVFIMYRYQKMIEKFSFFPEFESYIMTSSCMKRIVFKKKTSVAEYMFELRDSVFEPPIIYRQKEDKGLQRIPVDEIEDVEAQQFFKEIEAVVVDSNQDYCYILPNTRYETEGFMLEVSNLIEGYEDHTRIEQYPEELRIWVEFSRKEESICEVEYIFQNVIKNKPYPYWRMTNYFVKYLAIDKNVQLEDIILKQGSFFATSLNRPNRLHHLFADMNHL